jgi:hypothetical protein
MSTGLLIGSSIATGVGALGAAKMQSGAAGRSAQITTDAALRRAELERQTATEQLDYVKDQARMDRESARWADRQNYGLSKAEMMNRFSQRGDTAFNTRASEESRERTFDKRRGDTQRSLNTMRAMMGLPDKSLVSYVEPDELRLTAPTLPEYVEDPTQYTVDDEDVVPTTNTLAGYKHGRRI